MYWDVESVTPLSDYRLYVEMADRRSLFHVKPYLDHGLFRERRNPDYFRRVGIVSGALTRPQKQDIPPETLVAKLVPVDVVPNEVLEQDKPQTERP